MPNRPEDQSGPEKLDVAHRRIDELESGELAQLYLTSIIDSADDAIISKTLDGIVTSWNRGAERLFGYKANEMIGKPVAMLIPEDHPDEEPRILERLRRGERIEHYETERVRKDGKRIQVSLSVSPIRDKTGKVIGASKIARDITEQKMSLERERAALRQAEAANQLKDEFLAAVSHELRTPLTAVLGWIRMLRAGQLDNETMAQALDVIDRNVRSQAQLVEDLLDISGIIMGKFRLDVRLVHLSDVVTAAVESLRFAAEAKDIRIQTVLDSEAGPISGDAERLQQVVWNLLSNAIKFTPKHGSVHLSVERVDSHIEVRITDSGKGIAADFLPHVFERFTQAERTMNRKYGGLGLGLAIVRSITELHGGSISVESEGEGRGATFTVKLPVLPVRRQLAEDRIHPRSWTDVTLDCPPMLQNLNILVVDDEADTCEMLRALFHRCGGIVRTAGDGQAALEEVESKRPDVMVVDIGMPEMNGYEFIRRIREHESPNTRTIPAVALTAFARIEDRVKALASGFQMHVAKPVEPGELITIVASLAGFLPGKQAS